MNPYYTHRPYLIKTLENIIISNNNAMILELGVGDGSSEIMNKYATQYKFLQIFGFETDYTWASLMNKKYGRQNYSINHIDNWSDTLYEKIIEQYNVDKFDLVFVDQTPWQARINAINKLDGRFVKLILHDYDYYNSPEAKYSTGYDSFFKPYIDRYNLQAYFDILPPTLIFTIKDKD